MEIHVESFTGSDSNCIGPEAQKTAPPFFALFNFIENRCLAFPALIPSHYLWKMASSTLPNKCMNSFATQNRFQALPRISCLKVDEWICRSKTAAWICADNHPLGIATWTWWTWHKVLLRSRPVEEEVLKSCRHHRILGLHVHLLSESFCGEVRSENVRSCQRVQTSCIEQTWKNFCHASEFLIPVWDRWSFFAAVCSLLERLTVSMLSSDWLRLFGGLVW